MTSAKKAPWLTPSNAVAIALVVFTLIAVAGAEGFALLNHGALASVSDSLARALQGGR